jgi:hypothetical protein
VLKVTVPGVTIEGRGATLQASEDETSSVQVLADNVTIHGLTLTAATEGKRWEGLNQQKLAVLGASGVRIDDVTVNGSAAAGIFLKGANNFALSNIRVANTRADGIHITGGSSEGTVTNVTTANTGDDGVAVVSYGDAPPSHNVDIAGTVVNGSHARGVSVVGGEHIRIRDVHVNDTAAAGIYIAAEGSPYFTQSVEDVTVTNGTVTDANRDPGVVNGAILVFSGNPGQSVTHVDVNDISVVGTPESAERVVGLVANQGTVAGINFNNLVLEGNNVEQFYTNAPAGTFTLSNWS